ncbi:hypothetical protein ACQWF5_25530, partial [Salmonella enterica subsp. enterica serovar Infantis]
MSTVFLFIALVQDKCSGRQVKIAKGVFFAFLVEVVVLGQAVVVCYFNLLWFFLLIIIKFLYRDLFLL